MPCPFARPGRHLIEQLECPLCRARIAIGEAKIGIDNADQRHAGKIVPLGHQLRANDNIGVTLGNRLQFQPQPLDSAKQVRRQNQHPRIGEMPRRLFGNALYARPAGNQMIERTAFGAGFRPLLVVAAVMADELSPEPVLDQPTRTIRALEAMSAHPAQRQRCIAAPVEKQQRLLAPRQRLAISVSSTGDRKPPRAGAWRRMSTAFIVGRLASA